jgi:hypothetical protein
MLTHADLRSLLSRAVGRQYDLEAVVAYGAFAAPLMRKPASNREHSTTSAAVT